MSILQTVQESLGQPEITQISQKLGVDPQTAQKAVSAAVPMIVGGMAGHASQSPDGARDVQEVMHQHASAIEDVPQVVQTAPPTGGSFLSRIFGSHQETVQQGVQQASGLSFDKVKHLLSMISPLVLSTLARHRSIPNATDPANSQRVTNVLHHEAQQAQQEAPHVGGLLGKMLQAF